MSNFLPATLAVALLLGFLGILVWHVPRLDLMAVVGITVAFVLWDYVDTLRKGR
ncbi:MAG TPA: hypothetical protein VLA78_11785 [Paracoccaceae bacterium]|nr:hypothetical protein [Paracoccaceae bacterium]